MDFKVIFLASLMLLSATTSAIAQDYGPTCEVSQYERYGPQVVHLTFEGDGGHTGHSGSASWLSSNLLLTSGRVVDGGALGETWQQLTLRWSDESYALYQLYESQLLEEDGEHSAVVQGRLAWKSIPVDGEYIVNGAGSVESNPATLSVGYPPTIGQHPEPLEKLVRGEKSTVHHVPRVSGNQAARLYSPHHLRDALSRLRNEEDHEGHDRCIEAGFREGQRHCVTLLKLRYATGESRAGVCELGLGWIDSGDCARRAMFDKQLCECTISATYIDPAQIRGRRQPVEKRFPGDPAPLTDGPLVGSTVGVAYLLFGHRSPRIRKPTNSLASNVKATAVRGRSR